MKRLTLLFVAIAIILTGCGYSEEYVSKIKSEAYEIGYDDGYYKGEQSGYNQGVKDTKEVSYESGYDKGYTDGYKDGYSDYELELEKTENVNYGANNFTQKYLDSMDRYVYVTKTGRKYHKLGCTYLSESCYTISLKEAQAAGYTKCSRCWP